MTLGKWDSAIIKSIYLTAFLVLVYAAFEIGIPERLSDLAGFGIFTLLFVCVYLVFSIAGWLIVGFPAHWLICKYSSGSYFLYVGVVLLFTLAVYLLTEVSEAAFIYGFFRFGSSTNI